MTYSMTCTCAHTMTVDAKDRKDAIARFKAMMTPDMIRKHMAEKHAGEELIPTEAVHAMIEQSVVPAQ